MLEWLVKHEDTDGTVRYARGDADSMQAAQTAVAAAVFEFTLILGGCSLVIDIKEKN
jgi:hypothetical protein